LPLPNKVETATVNMPKIRRNELGESTLKIGKFSGQEHINKQSDYRGNSENFWDQKPYIANDERYTTFWKQKNKSFQDLVSNIPPKGQAESTSTVLNQCTLLWRLSLRQKPWFAIHTQACMRIRQEKHVLPKCFQLNNHGQNHVFIFVSHPDVE